MSDSLFSFAGLATLSGCSLAVYLLTQLTKGFLDRILHIHTELLAVFYAFILLVLTQIGLGGANYTNWRMYFLSALNALLVAATAAQIQSKAAFATGEARTLVAPVTTDLIQGTSSIVPPIAEPVSDIVPESGSLIGGISGDPISTSDAVTKFNSSSTADIVNTTDTGIPPVVTVDSTVTDTSAIIKPQDPAD